MLFYRIVIRKDRRPSILQLLLAECTAKAIFKQLQIPLRTVYNDVNKYKETGTMEGKPKNGKPKSATTKEIVKIIREKIAATLVGISARSVGRIVTSHLRLRSYKIRKAHMLTKRMKKTRFKRFRERLKRFSQARHSDILFTDECLFSTDQFLNT
uniref:Transposase n=1 Tax=Haemonchus contortus TaxID=6289 RepID=A0A7I4YW55_HAECO